MRCAVTGAQRVAQHLPDGGKALLHNVENALWVVRVHQPKYEVSWHLRLHIYPGGCCGLIPSDGRVSCQ